MIDFKKRYQTIKDKGAELSLSISSYLEGDYSLYFRNSYYCNFNTIPLEDFINLSKEKGYSIISPTLEGIESIPEGAEYHSLGYMITRYLRPDDNYIWEENKSLEELKKEKVNMRQYLPIELSLLFNTHNEETIEDTLSRYIKALFNNPLSVNEIKKEISPRFNKYALLFTLLFDNGYLLSPKYIKPTPDFKGIFNQLLLRENYSIRYFEIDNLEFKERLERNLLDDNLAFSPSTPFNEVEKKPSPDAIAYLKGLIGEENAIQLEDIKEEYRNAFYIPFIRSYLVSLNLYISTNKTLKERYTIYNELQEISKDETLLEEFSYLYLFLTTGKIKRVVEKKNKPSPSTIVVDKTEIELSPHFVSTGEPTLEIVKGFQASTSEVNNPEEIAQIERYREDFKLKEQLEGDIKTLTEQLNEEQKENGYNTPRGREIRASLEEKALQLNNLNLESRGKSEYAPFNYFVLDNRYRRLDNTALVSYQTTPTDSVIIVNNHTRLFASNSTIASFNALTTGVLVFLIACMVRANDKTFTLSNDEVEKFILKENYEHASIKDRNNARNQNFITALDLLSKTTIQTQYTPSKTAQRKGIGGRKRGSGSIISYSNTYKDIEITFNKDIYAIAFEDFPIIPLPPRVYDLKPRAFITAYYLHNLYAFNKNPTFSISIDRLIENNISYSGYLKNLKKNPDRLFKPILEDFQEMLEKEIISAYSPTIEEYINNKIRLKTENLITLTMTMKPQKKKGK